MMSDNMQADILIVDDTPENLTVLRQMLMDSGYRVRPALNGEIALRTVEQTDTVPDLILLDIMMPGMDGYQVCQRLKADERTQHIPVIFLSALDQTASKMKAFQVGGVDYISKPFQAEEVLARVQTHLALRSMHQQLHVQNSQLQQQNSQLSLLNHVSQMFGSSLELDQVLDSVLEETQRLLDVFSISVWLRDSERDELLCMHAKGPGSEGVINWRLPLGQGVTGWVAQHNKSAIVSDTWTDERHFKSVDKSTGLQVRSMLCVPLRVKGAVIGVLSLIDLRVGHFSQQDLLLLEPIAASAATAIENARLYTMTQKELAERKQAEAALVEAHAEVQKKNAQLQELNANKDKFFSIIAHDLQTPILNLLELTSFIPENIEQFSREELKETAQTLYSSLEIVHELMKNLFTWSGLQRGTLASHPQTIDVNDVVCRNRRLFLPQAEEKHVRLLCEIPANTCVHADPDMLYAVIRNLLSNALKFSFSGDTVTISATQSGHEVEVAVTDTGAGIEPQDLPKLFREDVVFQRPGTAGEEGTGLGLLLCKGLIERQDGRIWIESTLDEGTVARLILPQPRVFVST